MSTPSKIEALQAKLEKAQTEVRKIQTEIDNLTKFDNMQVGGLVGFTFGRGDSKKDFQGQVLGVGTLENGTEVVNVLVGQGINATVRRVPKVSINAYTAPTVAQPDALEAATEAKPAADQGPDSAVSKVDALLGGA